LRARHADQPGSLLTPAVSSGSDGRLACHVRSDAVHRIAEEERLLPATRQPAGGRLGCKIRAPARSKQPEVLASGVCFSVSVPGVEGGGMSEKRSRFRRPDVLIRSSYAGNVPINSCDIAATINGAPPAEHSTRRSKIGNAAQSGFNRPKHAGSDSLCRGGRHFGLRRLRGTCTPTFCRLCSDCANGSISRVVQARGRK
jgi:hypothetical protein